MKRVVMAVLILMVGIQFIPAKRSNPPVPSDFSGPEEVKAVLKRSCYDCHSNETEWPWYSRIAPVSWIVAHHVEEGRAHLNFSNWEPISENIHVRHEIYEETEEGKMPLASYLRMHPETGVTEEELELLRQWAEE